VKRNNSRLTRRRQKRPLTERELGQLWAEIQAADELDAGEEADLPECVPLPEQPEAVFAVFLQRPEGNTRG
jgi:hypothetical protein